MIDSAYVSYDMGPVLFKPTSQAPQVPSAPHHERGALAPYFVGGNPALSRPGFAAARCKRRAGRECRDRHHQTWRCRLDDISYWDGAI